MVIVVDWCIPADKYGSQNALPRSHFIFDALGSARWRLIGTVF
jgi:hypothetical protein